MPDRRDVDAAPDMEHHGRAFPIAAKLRARFSAMPRLYQSHQRMSSLGSGSRGGRRWQAAVFGDHVAQSEGGRHEQRGIFWQAGFGGLPGGGIDLRFQSPATCC
jgi:hypothetical protein